MALSKVDELVIGALGARRTQIAAQIDVVLSTPLSDLQQELSDIETKLKEIDPTIPSLAQDAQAVSGTLGK